MPLVGVILFPYKGVLSYPCKGVILCPYHTFPPQFSPQLLDKEYEITPIFCAGKKQTFPVLFPQSILVESVSLVIPFRVDDVVTENDPTLEYPEGQVVNGMEEDTTEQGKILVSDQVDGRLLWLI